MNKEASTPFDYDRLGQETRAVVEQKTNELHSLFKRTADGVLLIGEHLLSVKACLGHGHFENWLHSEFAITDRHARRFMNVAERFAGNWDKMSVFPVSILYELATPSTSEQVIEQVVDGQIDPSLAAIHAAKEAERQAHEALQQARREQETVQHQLLEERRVAQSKHDALVRQIEELTQAHPSSPSVKEAPAPSPEIASQLARLQQQLQTVIGQRDVLSRQVAELGEQARLAALRQNEGEGEQRVRLHWYQVTTEFHTCVLKLLAQWPSPIDTQVFDADDWARLAQTKEHARRLLEACMQLTQGTDERFVEGSVISSSHSEEEQAVSGEESDSRDTSKGEAVRYGRTV